MEFRLLGPLEVRGENGPLPLGGAKQRALLALLLLNANRVVPRDRLIDGLWGDDPPGHAVTSVQVYVSRLRKLLPPGTLVTRAPGYMLTVPKGSVDVLLFDRLLGEAWDAEPRRAAALLLEALELWRGPPLAEFADEPFARVEIDRLLDRRLRALEDRIDAELALGREGKLVGELTTLIAEHPYRERFRRQLMLALYRAARQSEALAAYRDARAALAELGLEPGPELRNLEQAILNQDPVLDARRPELAEPGLGRPALPGPLVPEPAFPFVGREDEVARLRALLDRAEQGEGAVAVLVGEAGSGKTRLAREVAHEAAARGALILYGSSDATVRIPYAPLRQWLEYLLRCCDRSELREYLGDGTILARLVPEVAAVAGAPAPIGDAETDRYLLQHAVAGLLGRLARRRALVAIADDVHWADDETLHLVRTLARTAPETRMLVVATYRDTPADTRPGVVDAIADLWRLDGVARLPLRGLAAEEVAALIRESASAEATPDLVTTLTDLTDGTPLLVCELWRELLATGSVEVSNQAVRLVSRIDDVAGPERIRDAVRQRLGRLGPDVAAIVQLAAVAGPTFDVQVITKAAGGDHAVVPNALDKARAGGLIEELPGPTRACRFTHELVRRAVYDKLGPLRRAELHLRVGEALERMHPDDPERVVQELAAHFTLAALASGPERAIQYNIRAAEAAVNADAYAEAADRLSTALELGIQDDRTRAHVQTELVMVQRGLGRFDQAEPLLAGIRDEPFAAAQARFVKLMNDPGVDPEDLLEDARRAIDTFTEAGDPHRLAVAWRHFGLVLRRQGRLRESVAAFENALRDAAAAGRRDAYRWAVNSLANVLCDGPVPVSDAIRRIDELERSSPEDAMEAAMLGQFKGGLLAMAGRLVEARELLLQSEAAFDRNPASGSNRPPHRELVAGAWELLGEPARAEQELVAKYEYYRGAVLATKADAQAMQAAYRLALLCCDEHRWEDAERWTEYGRDVPIPDHFLNWPVHRLSALSRIAAHRGDLESAVMLGRRAVDLAELSDATNRRAAAWLVLAEAHRARDETSEADAAVATALRLYEEKGNVTAARRTGTTFGLSVLSGREA